MGRVALRVWAEVTDDGEHCSVECEAYRHRGFDVVWSPTLRHCLRFGALTAHNSTAWRSKECLAAESLALRQAGHDRDAGQDAGRDVRAELPTLTEPIASQSQRGQDSRFGSPTSNGPSGTPKAPSWGCEAKEIDRLREQVERMTKERDEAEQAALRGADALAEGERSARAEKVNSIGTCVRCGYRGPGPAHDCAAGEEQ